MSGIYELDLLLLQCKAYYSLESIISYSLNNKWQFLEQLLHETS